MRRLSIAMLLTALLSLAADPTFVVAQEAVEETRKRLTEKVERVQTGAKNWADSGRNPAEIFKVMQEKFHPLMQAGKVAEAEAVLDGVLKQLGMDVNVPNAAAANGPSAEERVLRRIHLIQKERPAWLKKTDKQAEADALMQKLKGQLADMNFPEAEKTADSILKMMGLSIPVDQVQRTASANEPKETADPFAAFIPQQLVFLASDRIALTPEQRESLLVLVKTTQPRLVELDAELKHESVDFAALTSREQVDEAAALAQLDKFLDVQREVKQIQVKQGVTIQNLLTAEQRSKLRGLTENPDTVAKLEEELKSRIMAKVQRITEGAQRLAQSGRDPSFASQAMEQKVRPLMDSGRVFEAEMEIDQIIKQLDKDAK